MPRSNRPRRGRRPSPEPSTVAPVAPVRRESGPDGADWLVRPVPGAGSGKPYRCPGCDQIVPAGTPHVVAWPDDGSVAERRHWHTPCWSARHHRRPQQSRRRW
jgi:hypothetical protein